MPIAFLLPLLAVSSAAPSEARAAEHSCHWVEGRLQGGNGTPAYRIWPRGTRRLLGVTTAGFDAEAADVIPANVAHYLRANRTDRLWGRFLVCPLAPERAGRMRPVRLLAARRLSPAP
ncbi:MAG TPA: hypothetical protein VF603_00460 [Allosphingosinicella sp.]|jgi:hypothetical protein